jgi:hypothetical protein
MQIVLLIYLVASAIATCTLIAASMISSQISQRQEAIRGKRKYTRPALRTIPFPQWWSKFESRTSRQVSNLTSGIWQR